MTTRMTGGGDRRDFLKMATGAVAAAQLAGLSGVHADGSETIKVGLIGCGSRGSGAAVDACQADPRVRIVAMADLLKDRLDGSRNQLQSQVGPQFLVKDEHCFAGDFETYKKVLALDLDYVILATPPHFRPEHLAAAIEAGKNVFMEKPVAVDPVGCRSVMQSGDKAKEKGLSIVAGTQRRHQGCYVEAYKRILDGHIGKIVAARCYWNQGQLWHVDRKSGWSDMEWMIRDWVNWRWLSGDHIVEQHVHNIDVVNWFTGKHPVKAVGTGSRLHRPTGDQYDFFSVDFVYDDDMHLASYSRQINGCANNVSETVVGEKGSCFTDGGNARITGEKPWIYSSAPAVRANSRSSKSKAKGERPAKGSFRDRPYVQEHVDLIDSIVNKRGLNEARNIAISTLTAVMGRIAAYTGKEVTWDEMMKSDLRLGPSKYDFEYRLPDAQIPVAGTA